MKFEFDCTECKHNPCDDAAYPCCDCKGTAGYLSDEYYKRPLFFDPEDEIEERNAVHHPQHYNHGKYECIDVMVENFGKEAVKHFCLLNAFKYVWRTNYKNGVEDVKKAMFYLDYYLKLEGEAHD